MNNDLMIKDIKEKMLELHTAITTAIVKNLLKVDEEGYSFFTNQINGKIIPYEFAIECGFKSPLFKIKETATAEDGTILPGYEALWVKEGLE